MGIYVFDTEVLFDDPRRRRRRRGRRSTTSARDVLPGCWVARAGAGPPFRGSCVMSKGAVEPYWRDVGTLDAFWEANMDLLWSRRHSISTTTPGRSGPTRSSVRRRSSCSTTTIAAAMAVDSLVSAGCVVSGGRVRRSLLFTDVRDQLLRKVEDSLILSRVGSAGIACCRSDRGRRLQAARGAW